MLVLIAIVVIVVAVRRRDIRAWWRRRGRRRRAAAGPPGRDSASLPVARSSAFRDLGGQLWLVGSRPILRFSSAGVQVEDVLLPWDARTDAVMPAPGRWSAIYGMVQHGRAWLMTETVGGWSLLVRRPLGITVTAQPPAPAPSTWTQRWIYRAPLAPADHAVQRGLPAVLERRTELRPALDDPQRVQALVAAIERWDPAFRAKKRGGTRRTTVEIDAALGHLGFVHEHERPMPDDVLPSLDAVVDAVLERLGENPFTRTRTFARDDVVERARRSYLDVEPWPFTALLP